MYFHKYGVHWNTEIIVVPISGIISNDVLLNKKHQLTEEQVIPLFSKIERQGNNEEVFFYQFAEGGSVPLVMLTFYEKIKILLCPSKS